MNPTANLYRRPRTPLIIPERAALRAASKYVEDEKGCWISTYSTGSHGYAQVGWDEGNRQRRATTAHRAAWVHHTGQQIPEGMTVDHICKTHRCVNPAHLRVLTNYENARRTNGDDWELGTCKNGHPDTNLRPIEGGRRFGCYTCSKERQARYRAKRKAAKAAA